VDGSKGTSAIWQLQTPKAIKPCGTLNSLAHDDGSGSKTESRKERVKSLPKHKLHGTQKKYHARRTSLHQDEMK